MKIEAYKMCSFAALPTRATTRKPRKTLRMLHRMYMRTMGMRAMMTYLRMLQRMCMRTMEMRVTARLVSLCLFWL